MKQYSKQYIVTTAHGDYNLVNTLKEAKSIADDHMKKYLSGTQSEIDPRPVIREVEYTWIHSFYFDRESNKYRDSVPR